MRYAILSFVLLLTIMANFGLSDRITKLEKELERESIHTCELPDEKGRFTCRFITIDSPDLYGLEGREEPRVPVLFTGLSAAAFSKVKAQDFRSC